MAKSSSKKRERTDEDVADNHDAKPAVKKSKIDSNGKAEVTKKSSKVKEAKSEPAATEEAPKAKKEKKEKKDKKEKAEKAEKKDKKEDKAEKAEKEEKKDKKDKKEKRDKKEKKDKKTKAKDVEPATESDSPEQAAPSAPEPATKQAANGDKKSKKQKKGKKQPTTTSSSDTPTNGADEPATTTTTTDEPTTNGKQNRFICFVGNLPFTATADEVRAHFASLQPTSVRLLTQRDNPSKSRGIAFVEFAGYDHMKTCLAKFHHSEFDDGSAQPRRINVELTAGGGGKTAARQDKIKTKNAKLNEERAGRMKREEEAKHEKAMNKAAGGQAPTPEQREEDSIHPSRRARVPYGKN